MKGSDASLRVFVIFFCSYCCTKFSVLGGIIFVVVSLTINLHHNRTKFRFSGSHKPITAQEKENHDIIRKKRRYFFYCVKLSGLIYILTLKQKRERKNKYQLSTIRIHSEHNSKNVLKSIDKNNPLSVCQFGRNYSEQKKSV